MKILFLKCQKNIYQKVLTCKKYLNKERFFTLANETSRKVRTSISKFITGEQGYTDEKPEIKIIDINALLEKIQADKKQL